MQRCPQRPEDEPSWSVWQAVLSPWEASCGVIVCARVAWCRMTKQSPMYAAWEITSSPLLGDVTSWSHRSRDGSRNAIDGVVGPTSSGLQ